MKLFFILLGGLIFSATSEGQSQNPYKKYAAADMKDVRGWADPIPIDKGQEEKYFNYAVRLFKQDSLQKAGQIFDRVYWLDTASQLGRRALEYRNKIENRISASVKKALVGTWDEKNCPSDLATGSKISSEKKNKQIVFQRDKIIFYEGDKITTTTAYQLTELFNWVDGFSHNCVKYSDTGEEWYYDMRELDSFVSDNLRLTLKSSVGHTEKTACYKKK